MEDLAYVQTRAIEESHWWFLGMREIYRKQLESIPRDDPWEILDVGCGTGGNLPLLSSFGRTVGVDYAPAAASFTRGRGWSRVAVGSATELPFPEEHFHLVTAFGVIEHLEDDAAMLGEMRRVTRPGGHLLFMTSAHPWLWSAHDDAVHHQRRYRRRELATRVRETGWHIEQLSYVNAALFPPIAAVRLLQRLLPRRSPEQGMSGFFVPPGPGNRALAGLLSLEGSLMRRWNLPMGVGFICRARREEV